MCKKKNCHWYSIHTDTCDYYLLTGRRKKIVSGQCDAYKPREKRNGRPVLPTTFKKGKRDGLYTAIESLYEEGMSDREIGEALGIPKGFVARWRRGERLPSRETRRQIKAAHEKAAAVLNGGDK